MPSTNHLPSSHDRKFMRALEFGFQGLTWEAFLGQQRNEHSSWKLDRCQPRLTLLVLLLRLLSRRWWCWWDLQPKKRKLKMTVLGSFRKRERLDDRSKRRRFTDCFQRRRLFLSVDLLLKWVGIFSPSLPTRGRLEYGYDWRRDLSFLGSSQCFCTFGFCINITIIGRSQDQLQNDL